MEKKEVKENQREDKSEKIETEETIEKKDKSEVIEKVYEPEIIQTTTEDSRKGLSIASMVLGICSIVFCNQFIIAVACGILGIVFGIKGKKRAGKKMAQAGIITGIIGLCIEAFLFILGIIIGIAMVGTIFSSI